MELNLEKFQQGAEAILYRGVYLGKQVIAKERFVKRYRHANLDKHLTRERIKAECRAIVKCKSAGIFTPTIYLADMARRLIIMEYFVNSISVKDFLLNAKSDTDLEELSKNIGLILAKMHSNNIVHGDLTTSNMLLVNKNNKKEFSNCSDIRVALIDFGLSHTEASAEDKGVDLYVLERALISMHHNTDVVFPLILKAYKDFYKKGHQEVIMKFEEVRARGRKRTMAWMKEGLPSLICSTCIERLRVAYDFRNVCLQSDQTLQKYVSHLQHDFKEPMQNNQQPLTVSKFDLALLSQNQENLPCIVEEPQNAEYLHLKHFLDNDEDLSKSDNLADTTTSRSSSPETVRVVSSFLHEPQRLPEQQSQQLLHQTFHHQQHQHTHQSQQTHLSLEEQQPQHPPNNLTQQAIHNQSNHQQQIQPANQQHQFDNVLQHPQILHNQSIGQINQDPETRDQAKNESKTPKQVIMRTMGIQVRPPTPSSLQADGKNIKMFTCTICGKSYRKNANLRVHTRIHTGEKPFECKYCDKRFYHSSHLREHIRRHTGEKPFQCAICNKRFTIRGELTMHMKSHTGEKPYACTCCNRRCLTAADLKLHMRIHTGEKPFMCNTCGRHFASTYILNAHIKTHTGERPYSCLVCNKTFTQSSHLQVHMRKHTGEKVCCKVCDAKFSYSSQLTIHMREHTGKQPYKCTLCDKNCKYASEYETHMRKHTGEKFSCNTCEKKFMTASYLQEHNRTHTGQNLSTCSICDRQFTRPTYLEKHMRTHTGERPYACVTCGKKFTQSSSLKVHIRTHTGEKPFQCQICDRRFTTSSDLSSHNKKHDKKYISL